MKKPTLQSTPWLVSTPAPASKMRLFCFPYAGGNAFSFVRWQDSLDSSVQVAAVQLPGRGARIGEAPIASMPDLLRALAPVIAAHDDLPFAFFGHSVGALVAFELTRYMHLHGLKLPCRLFVSGCQAPQYRSPSRQLHLLPDAAFTAVLGDYNGTPPEVIQNRELMQLFLPTIRADFSLAEDYRYRRGPLLPMPISVFAGRDDNNKAPGQVDGWTEEGSQPCRVSWFDGGHFFINNARDAVLQQLDAELAMARQSTTQPAAFGVRALRA